MKKSRMEKNGFILKVVAGSVFILLFTLLLSSCGGRYTYYFDNLLKLTRSVYKGQKPSKKSIEDLKKGIKKYKKEVERTVKASEQLGIYYKMLAVKYMDLKMYGEAAKSLEKAIEIYPENPILFYLTGVCCGYMAKAQEDPDNRSHYLNLSEKYYKHALSIDPSYSDALYGLSVLYVFELNKPESAVSLLKSLLVKEKENTDAMFLLARAYYEMSQYERAIEMYNRIEKSAGSKIKKEEAERNKKKVEAEIYGK